MANLKSSIKRIQTSERNRIQNSRYKSYVKTLTKKYFQALQQYQKTKKDEDKDLITLLLALTYSKIDKAKKKNVFHKNTASRKKAKLGKAQFKLLQKKVFA